jgi:sarcosine oxidase subunit alpha
VVDGRDVLAAEGEAVASALVASGRWVFGRSVKYHRARGPSCFSGRCEGCLMRVDGVPGVMTCRTSARHGMRCDAQNVVGSAEHDLLAVTDFLFPAGLDHHEMFTWSKPVNRSMQLVAREIAGVGELPDAPEPSRPVARRDADVLVIGAGLSGLCVAASTARAGLKTLVLDEGHAWTHTAEAVEAARRAGAELRFSTAALGVFAETDGRRVVLADAAEGALTVLPKVVVIAQGRAETGATFEGNDLPGIVSASGAEALLEQAILVGDEVVVAIHEREAAVGARIAARLRAAGAKVTEIAETDLSRARGRGGVRSLETARGELACDALVLASRRGPVTELAQQAGAKVRWDGEVFVLDADDDGRTAHPRTFVVGSAWRDADEPELTAQAERAARAVIEAARG